MTIVQSVMQSNLYKRDVNITAEQSRSEHLVLITVLLRVCSLNLDCARTRKGLLLCSAFSSSYYVFYLLIRGDQ
jgi:hypothetical protein